MEKEDQTVRIYTGTEISVQYVKAELEASGIGCLVQNDFNSGVMAGFAGGVPSAIDLYVLEADAERARLLVAEIDETPQ